MVGSILCSVILKTVIMVPIASLPGEQMNVSVRGHCIATLWLSLNTSVKTYGVSKNEQPRQNHLVLMKHNRTTKLNESDFTVIVALCVS